MGIVATLLRTIGQVADDAANVVTELPIKVGAVADDVVAAVADGDKVHLVTDLLRKLRVNAEGGVADDAANVTTNFPVKVGAVAVTSKPSAVTANDVVHLTTTEYRELRTVAGGYTLDDAAADALAPLKLGAIADAILSTVSDGDMAHLVTDLYRRLRVAISRDYLEASWADLSNVAADAYYPSEDGFVLAAYDSVSLTGKVICGADNTSVLTIEATNDEDATPANRDWQTLYVYSNTLDTNINSIATGAGATSQIALSMNGLNFRYVRAKYDITRATTNNDTVILKARYQG